jgi:hypothetical protein
MSPKRKAFLGFLIGVTAVAAPFVGMAAAHADTNDDAFVMALRADGVGVNSSVSSLVSLGHEVCHAATKGLTDSQMAVAIAGADFSMAQSFFIIGAAEAAYCPQYASRGVNENGTGA